MRYKIAQFTACTTLLFAGWYYILVALPAGAEPHGLRLSPDLYPMWLAARVVLVGRGSPYTSEVTREIQRGVYGSTIRGDGRVRDQQRFAYPLFAVFPFAPLAFLSFATVQALVFWLFLGFSVLSVWLWAKTVDVPFLAGLCGLILASVPIDLGIVLRQPTVAYILLLALSAWAARSRRYVLAGVAAAFASAKPQLAVAVLVPLLFWALSAWQTRKRMAFSFAVTFAVLASAAFIWLPAWLQEWLITLAAYKTYANATPIFFESANLIAVGAVTASALVWRARKDLQLALAISVVSSQLFIPFQEYNLALLVPAMLYTWKHREQMMQRVPSRVAMQIAVVTVAAYAVSIPAACAISSLWILPPILFIAFGLSLLPVVLLQKPP